MRLTSPRVLVAIAAAPLIAGAVTAAPASAATDALAGAVHYASDVPWESMTNGWGPVELDMSNGSRTGGAADASRYPLTLGGVVYAKGLGAHAPSSVVYDLGGQCRQLLAYVGVDDGQGGKGHVIFQVRGDGVTLASVEKSGGQAGTPVNVDLAGVDRLELAVDAGPEGNGNDHSDWADARLNCTDGYIAQPLVVAPAPGTLIDALLPGTDATVTATGLEPGTAVQITMGGTDVATGTADAQGAVSATLTVPADAPAGPTEIVVAGAARYGATATGSLTATVRHVSERAYYVDCTASVAGAGTIESPFSSLAQVREHGEFSPGESILLRAGTTCTGPLEPLGTGAAGHPITIGAYGDGDRPTVDGAGAVAAIRLADTSHWSVRGLHVVNPAADLARRVGILYETTNPLQRAGVVIEDNLVEDIAGWTDKTGARQSEYVLSAAIMVQVSSGTGAFDGIEITGNEVRDAGGGGIKLSGDTAVKHQRVHISDNLIERVGGDGIVVHNADAPLVEHNRAFDLGLGRYPFVAGNFAGMWPYNSHDPVFQYNVVGNSTTSTYDATAWDCDISVTGTCLFQYNYSFGNGGGFYLDCVSGCGSSATTTNVVLRYNVAQDDCRIAGASGGPGRHLIYNNTFYCPSRGFQDDMRGPRYVANNLIVAPSGTLREAADAEYRTNAYAGGILPPDSETGAVTADPQLVAGGSGQRSLELPGYALRAGSPLIGAGTPIVDDGGRDWSGAPIPGAPNIGVYQGAGESVGALPFASLVNHVAVTSEQNPRNGALTTDRRTFSSEALAEAGLVVGESALVGDVAVDWHPAAVGVPDAVKAAGQEVALSGRGRTLALVGFATGGAQTGVVTVHYADGRSQRVDVTMPDWRGSATDAAIPGDRPGTADAARAVAVADRHNQHTQAYLGGASTVVPVRETATVFGVEIHLIPGLPVTSVTLPDGSPYLGSGISLLGLAIG